LRYPTQNFSLLLAPGSLRLVLYLDRLENSFSRGPPRPFLVTFGFPTEFRASLFFILIGLRAKFLFILIDHWVKFLLVELDQDCLQGLDSPRIGKSRQKFLQRPMSPQYEHHNPEIPSHQMPSLP
jgi:hypothetical protein